MKRKTIKEYKRENELLRNIIVNTFWMARRYAHGRHTYAPSLVREAYVALRKIGIHIRHDITINAPTHKLKGFDFRSDYLDNINIKEEE